MSNTAILKYFFLIFLIASVLSDNCKISWIETGHEVAESQYTLELSIVNTTGDLRTYFPNTYYDITIKSKLKNHTFTQFYFTIWNTNKTMTHGILELREKELSMFHNAPYCINRIIDGPVSLSKLNLKIGWQSPPVNSGCIELRAAVKETELRYHIANKTVCQDPRVVLDDPGEILKNCCACDEGKYELIFEGLWSRYTHPKHFPRREWLAVFPTVIGASHSEAYEFWHAYTNASDGLKKFAETGYTVALELELKSNKQSISTLIKFQGANFQNKTRQSYAGVRVNPEKHLVSLVARIDPSPDWFVGVSSLELCQPDCTWIKSKTLNLYAYDAGIRNGIVYEDNDEITEPPDIIQSLNMTWPPTLNNIESPFYDATNNTHDVRPLARIHFRRLRGSEKSCQHTEIIDTEDCVTPWSKWDDCSVECGEGISKRRRSVKKTNSVSNCTMHLEESKTCQGAKAKCKAEITKELCALTEWGEWTKCEKICGQETIKRSRSYKWANQNETIACHKKFGNMSLEEQMECGNPPCPQDGYICVAQRYNPWSDWTPCSVTEGRGIQIRYRTVKEHTKKNRLYVPDGDVDFGYSACLYDIQRCAPLIVPPKEDVISNTNFEDTREMIEPIEIVTSTTAKPVERPNHCLLPPDEGSCPDGQNDNSHRYYYDESKGKCLIFRYSGCGGNENRFNDERACTQTCVIHGRKIDCVMSKWSEWSACKDCMAFRSREKKIEVYPENGGRSCSYERVQTQFCKEVLPKCSK